MNLLPKTTNAHKLEHGPYYDTCENHLLMNLAIDVCVFNNYSLITKYQAQPTKIGGLISDGIFIGRGSIRLRLGLKNSFERLILKIKNVYYFLKSFSNFISLGLLNNSDIYHNNEN